MGMGVLVLMIHSYSPEPATAQVVAVARLDARTEHVLQVLAPLCDDSLD